MKKVEIIITLDGKGGLQVSAPPDKILSLGMLEFAKHILLNQPLREAPSIQVPMIIPKV